MLEEEDGHSELSQFVAPSSADPDEYFDFNAPLFHLRCAVTTPPSQPGGPYVGKPCPCSTDKIWLDVIVAIDNSASMGQNGLNQVTATRSFGSISLHLLYGTHSQLAGLGEGYAGDGVRHHHHRTKTTPADPSRVDLLRKECSNHCEPDDLQRCKHFREFSVYDTALRRHGSQSARVSCRGEAPKPVSFQRSGQGRYSAQWCQKIGDTTDRLRRRCVCLRVCRNRWAWACIQDSHQGLSTIWDCAMQQFKMG